MLSKKNKSDDLEVKSPPKEEVISTLFNIDRGTYMGLAKLKADTIKSHKDGYIPTSFEISFNADFSQITFTSKAKEF